MSKQYKFRGYDKVNKRMFEVYGLGVDWCTENTLDGVNENHNYWDGESFKKNIVIMQYIGESDKNGIEIYESDIMQPELYLKTNWLRGVVSFVNTAFTLKGANYSNEQIIHSMNRAKKAKNDMVVIGNIYENPNLLPS